MTDLYVACFCFTVLPGAVCHSGHGKVRDLIETCNRQTFYSSPVKNEQPFGEMVHRKTGAGFAVHHLPELHRMKTI